MAIRIKECGARPCGCLVAFVPDRDDAALFLMRACRVYGWSMSLPAGPDARGALTAFVRGASAAAFRSEFDGMPEFDFSRCDEETATDRRGPEDEDTFVIGP
jgi:hypothetical protein